MPGKDQGVDRTQPAGSCCTPIRFTMEVVSDSRISPPPRGGEGGVSRSTAPRRRSRPAMQRGPWKGSGERETVMTFIIGGILQSHDRLGLPAQCQGHQAATRRMPSHRLGLRWVVEHEDPLNSGCAAAGHCRRDGDRRQSLVRRSSSCQPSSSVLAAAAVTMV